MDEQLPRSPYDMVDGVFYFPRMLDKIRLQTRGALSEAYHDNLGCELDGHRLTFLLILTANGRELTRMTVCYSRSFVSIRG